MSNRWNQTRAVNRRPKVCLSKHPRPTFAEPSGPCSITPPRIVRTITANVFSTYLYRLDSLNDPPLTPGPLTSLDSRFVSRIPYSLFNEAENYSDWKWIGPPGNYEVTLVSTIPSGCNPTTTIDLRVV